MPVNTTPHIHHVVMCANIFVRKDGKYLLLKRSPLKKYAPNFVHPIGGKIDADEDPFLAAEREVLEEAGIRVCNVRLEAVVLEIKPAKGEDENWIIFHFSADYESGELSDTEEGEFVMLTKEQIYEQNLFPSVRVIIKNILDPRDGTVFLTVEYDEQGQLIQTTKKLNICAL
ncbi:MAG TPA: NUDIX domain-containing protein [Patescibacteria group bacterium]|nr:NUDIX domain-containing protein [Patescibacteria group bacterium]